MQQDEAPTLDPTAWAVATRLTREEYENIRALAAANDRSISAEVRRAIRAHLERGGEHGTI